MTLDSQTISIDCAWLLTSHGWQPDQRLKVSGDGTITSIKSVERQQRACADHRLSGWVIPGMCNVHSHAHQRLIAGLTGWREPGQSSFWSWREQMYRALQSLTVADLGLIARYLYAELLEGGYTSVGEFHYAHHLQGSAALETSTALIEAADFAGCGLTLLPVWYRYGGFGKRQLDERQQLFALSGDEVLELIQAIASLAPSLGQGYDQIRVGLAPHSLRAVALDELQVLLEQITSGPIHLHIAEQKGEVNDCLKYTGQRPIEFLFSELAPSSDWCLIHATHCAPFELELMADSGVVIGLCPSTEADLGDGIFPALDWQRREGLMAIGSDSNVVTSAASELRQLEWSQRLVGQQRNILIRQHQGHIGTSLWTETASAGAQALAQNAGQLAPGRRADFLELNSSHPLLQGLAPDQVMDSLVMSEQPGMIKSVWVAGQCRVVDGVHRDREQLQQAFAELRARVLGRPGA